jgi:1-acyl-sn-glycerol-3-phosphate acyltransferase
MFYRFFRLLAAISLRLFFRRIEVEGAHHVPATGPILLVPNHTNALVDPLLPLIVLDRPITLTAKNVLKSNPLLALLCKGLGAVLFHRPQDIAKGANPRENVRSMGRCREILAAGGAVCIFPEGISHSDLQMREFHSGPSRIALDFVKKDHNPGRLKIVPVGLLYEHKNRFRSDVWLRFGEPYDAEEWLAAHPDARPDDLSADFRARVEKLILSYHNRREMLLVTWASDLLATQGLMPRPLGSSEPPVAESFRRLALLQAGYRELLHTRAPEVHALGDRVRAHHALLKRHGISAADVYLPLSPLRAVLFLVRELELLLVGFPLAAFGFLNHLLPYLAVRTTARALSTDKDHWATNVVYPSFLIFPLFYALQLTAAWLFLPRPWPAVYTLALPYTGIYCILYHDRAASALRRTRTYLHFLFNRRAQNDLAAQGRTLLTEIYALASHLQSPPPVPPHLERPAPTKGSP